MEIYNKFKQKCREEIKKQNNDDTIKISNQWISHPLLKHYSYHFEWMGRPIIQYPQDMIVLQELIWSIKPDLIIETGIAHGGSLIFYASLLELNAICGGPYNAHVLGVDIDIRAYNRTFIEEHPMARRISMFEGSSISEEIINKIKDFSKNYKTIMICLDSNHTKEHVLAELDSYAPLTSVGSYCVVFDTIIENMSQNAYPDRPWGKGNNPLTAVSLYLKNHPEFKIDDEIDAKLLISVAPHGYLKRIF